MTGSYTKPTVEVLGNAAQLIQSMKADPTPENGQTNVQHIVTED